MPSDLARRLRIWSGLCLLTGLATLSSSWASDSAIKQSIRDTPFLVGQLTCTMIGESQPDPSGIAQGRDVSCQFRPGISGAEETYVGTLQGAGQVKKLFELGTIMLLVKQIGSDAVTPGILAQSYSADASTRSGRSAPLIGDRNNRVVLLPLMGRGEQTSVSDAPDALIVLADLKLLASPA